MTRVYDWFKELPEKLREGFIEKHFGICDNCNRVTPKADLWRETGKGKLWLCHRCRRGDKDD